MQPATPQPGLCQCGCGQPTSLARRTDPAAGYVRGQPKRFRRYHNVAAMRAQLDSLIGPFEDRFWARVERGAGCWEWQGPVFQDTGYGMVAHARGPLGAHRVAWELTGGPIPDGLMVLHNCPGGDNRRCVRPGHLYLGTHADNMADMAQKGRAARGERNGTHLHPERVARGERVAGAKLTADTVRRMRALAATGMTGAGLAARFGVSRSAACRAIRGQTWGHVGTLDDAL